MSFRSVFIALVIGFGLVLGGYLINRQRPRSETGQPSAEFVRATSAPFDRLSCLAFGRNDDITGFANTRDIN